jgi:hypothetical protein
VAITSGETLPEVGDGLGCTAPRAAEEFEVGPRRFGRVRCDRPAVAAVGKRGQAAAQCPGADGIAEGEGRALCTQVFSVVKVSSTEVGGGGQAVLD